MNPVPECIRTNHYINMAAMDAFAEGCGGTIVDISESHPPASQYDFIATYGILRGTATAIKNSKDYIYIDRGYFEPGNVKDLKYFRVTKNATIHSGEGDNCWDRFEKFNYQLNPWKKDGKNIVVIPPNKPMAKFLDIKDWIDTTLVNILKNTDRDIIISRKSFTFGTNPLLHSKIEDKIPQVKSTQESFDEALKNAWVVVTDHSNCMTKSLMEGVPIICTNVNRNIGSFEKIESPTYNREILKNLAYNQWTLDEMRSGQTWRELNK